MGLFDRFKKGPDSENRNNSETPDGTGNYMHLAGLLTSAKYADLDCDIAVGNLEKRLYKHGMPVLENTIVDGNGHTVDARGIARIFYIKERNIVIKNMTFINGFDEHGGAIVIDKNASVEIRDCTFKGNRAKQLGGAIINFGSLSLENVRFIDNSSESDGGAVNNQPNAEVSVSNCSFRQNSSNKYGGALINMSERTLRISNTEFIRNSSSADGGAVNNNANSANMIIDDSRFAENRSALGGGAIINWGDSTIRNSQFQGNFSKTNGNDINFQKGSMQLLNAIFDYPKESSIFLANEDLVNIEDCEFAHDDE